MTEIERLILRRELLAANLGKICAQIRNMQAAGVKPDKTLISKRDTLRIELSSIQVTINKLN